MRWVAKKQEVRQHTYTYLFFYTLLAMYREAQCCVNRCLKWLLPSAAIEGSTLVASAVLMFILVKYLFYYEPTSFLTKLATILGPF